MGENTLHTHTQTHRDTHAHPKEEEEDQEEEDKVMGDETRMMCLHDTKKQPGCIRKNVDNTRK